MIWGTIPEVVRMAWYVASFLPDASIGEECFVR